MKNQTIHSSNPSVLKSQSPQIIRSTFPKPISFLNPNSEQALTRQHLTPYTQHPKKLLSFFILLTLITLTLISIQTAANAQFMHSNPPIEAYVSAGAGYNYEIEAVSVRIFFGFPATREFYSYSIDGGYYLHDLDGRANTGDMNFNLRFFVPGSDVFRPYVLAGANFTHYSQDFWGVNLGGGLQVAIGRVFLFARAHYTIGELDMLSINSGLSFLFPTSMQ